MWKGVLPSGKLAAQSGIAAAALGWAPPSMVRARRFMNCSILLSDIQMLAIPDLGMPRNRRGNTLENVDESGIVRAVPMFVYSSWSGPLKSTRCLTIPADQRENEDRCQLFQSIFAS